MYYSVYVNWLSVFCVTYDDYNVIHSYSFFYVFLTVHHSIDLF
jgi:hypothetical protein